LGVGRQSQAPGLGSESRVKVMFSVALGDQAEPSQEQPVSPRAAWNVRPEYLSYLMS